MLADFAKCSSAEFRQDIPNPGIENCYTTNADQTVGLCCLCDQCDFVANGRDNLLVDEFGTTCYEMLLEMADDENDSRPGNNQCRSLQAQHRQRCCDATYTPPQIAQAPTPAPVINLPIGNEPFCNLCPDGGEPELPLTVVAILYIPGVNKCQTLYEMGRRGLILDRLCNPIQDYLFQDCGCDRSQSYQTTAFAPKFVDLTTNFPTLAPTRAPVVPPTREPTRAPVVSPTGLDSKAANIFGADVAGGAGLLSAPTPSSSSGDQTVSLFSVNNPQGYNGLAPAQPMTFSFATLDTSTNNGNTASSSTALSNAAALTAGATPPVVEEPTKTKDSTSTSAFSSFSNPGTVLLLTQGEDAPSLSSSEDGSGDEDEETNPFGFAFSFFP